jgi:hypothetical protein
MARVPDRRAGTSQAQWQALFNRRRLVDARVPGVGATARVTKPQRVGDSGALSMTCGCGALHQRRMRMVNG